MICYAADASGEVETTSLGKGLEKAIAHMDEVILVRGMASLLPLPHLNPATYLNCSSSANIAFFFIGTTSR